MNMVKSLGFVGLATTALFAAQAFATPCPIVNGMQTQGSPVCIAPYGPLDGAGTGLVNVLAGPGNTTDYNSNSIFSTGMGVNPYTGQTSPSSYWAINGTGGSENTMMFTLSGSTANTTFGIFDPSHINGGVLTSSNSLALFTGASTGLPAGTTLSDAGYQTTLSTDGQGLFKATYNTQASHPGASETQSVTFGDGNLFGYYLQVGGNTYFSDMSLNGDGVAHMAAFAGDGQQGAIRLTNGVFSLGEFLLAWEDGANGGDLDYNDFVVMVESVHPVPEPANLALFGFGALLIGGFVTLRRRRAKA